MNLLPMCDLPGLHLMLRIRKIKDKEILRHQIQRVSTSAGTHDAHNLGFGYVNAGHATIMHVARTAFPSSSLT
eukprot:4076638-Amphidinium_carterae.1